MTIETPNGMKMTYTRDTNTGHENARWFAEIFGANQNVMRIVVAGRSSITECPGTATYQPGDAKVFVHPFDTQSDEQRETYRRHLLTNLHTQLGEYGRNDREIKIFGSNPVPVAPDNWGGNRKGSGRPRKNDAPRCNCGCMTLKRALARCHKC